MVAPTATLFSNGPLALIQLSLEVELNTLERVLKIELTDVKKLRKKENENTIMG